MAVVPTHTRVAPPCSPPEPLSLPPPPFTPPWGRGGCPVRGRARGCQGKGLGPMLGQARVCRIRRGWAPWEVAVAVTVAVVAVVSLVVLVVQAVFGPHTLLQAAHLQAAHLWLRRLSAPQGLLPPRSQP